MTDPFATALAALFNAPGSVAAEYFRSDDYRTHFPLRIIWDQGSAEAGARAERRVDDTNHFDVQRVDVPTPVKGDAVQFTDPVTGAFVTLKINGAAILDVEGMTWTCPAEPAAGVA